MGMIFGSRSEVRKFSSKEVRKELDKPLKNFNQECTLESESFENFSFF